MRNLKLFLTVLLVIGLITLGLLLPTAAAKIQDGTIGSQVYYGEINRVQLEFAPEGLTMTQKLVTLACNNRVIEIPEGMAVHSMTDILAIAEEKLAYCQMNDIVDNYNISIYSHLDHCQPALTTAEALGGEEGYQNIFWYMAWVGDAWRLSMCIDDKTGALMGLYYGSYDSAEIYSPERKQAKLDALTNLILAELGEDFQDALLKRLSINSNDKGGTYYSPMHIHDEVFEDLVFTLYTDDFSVYTDWT